MKLAALLSLVLLVAGCATMPLGPTTKVWYQPGKTDAQLRTDWAESQIVAAKALADVPPPRVGSDNDFVAGAAVAASRDARNAAQSLAPLTMQSRGYQLVPFSTVPAGAAYLRP